MINLDDELAQNVKN